MNFGHWYYQEYFDTINLNREGIVTNFSKFNKGENDKLKGATLPSYKENIEGLRTFDLTTCYPGLLCGVGYHHEINNPKNELQEKEELEVYNLGMYFDYTSGLPVIPGSSIKGALRSAIEEWDFLGYKEGDEQKEWNGWDKKKFIREIFEGEGKSIYDKDIFLDAYPFTVTDGCTLFGEDYITHHENPLRDPKPIRFLRINSGVTYRFRFLFRNNDTFTAEVKKELFREIILTFGLGAKTNVGYGHFTGEKY